MSIKVGPGGVDHDISVINAVGDLIPITRGILIDAAGVETTFYDRIKDITISGNYTTGLNLDDLYEDEFGLPSAAVTVRFTITNTAKIRDTNRRDYLIYDNNPSRITPIWQPGTKFIIINNSPYIGMAGGKGGDGAPKPGGPESAQRGCGFLKSDIPTDFYNTSILRTGGGGGGGGKSDTVDSNPDKSLGAGGGGAGGMRTGEALEMAIPTIPGGEKGYGMNGAGTLYPAWDGNPGSNATSTYGASGGAPNSGSYTTAPWWGGDGGYRGMRGHPPLNYTTGSPAGTWNPGDAGALFSNPSVVTVKTPGTLQGRTTGGPTIRDQNSYYASAALSSISYIPPSAIIGDMSIILVTTRYSGTVPPGIFVAGHTLIGSTANNGTSTSYFYKMHAAAPATTVAITSTGTMDGTVIQGYSITAGTYDNTVVPILGSTSVTTSGTARNVNFPDLFGPYATWGYHDGLFLCSMASMSYVTSSSAGLQLSNQFVNKYVSPQITHWVETHIFRSKAATNYSPGQAINTMLLRSFMALTLGIKGI